MLDNSALKCWGSNQFGQLGLGDTAARGDGANELGNSLPVVDLGTVRASAHARSGCWAGLVCCLGAIGADAREECLTRSSERDTSVFSQNSFCLACCASHSQGRTAKAAALGSTHTCALLDNGQIKCWGNGYATGPATKVAIGVFIQNDGGMLGYEDVKVRGDGPGETADNLLAVDLGMVGCAPATDGRRDAPVLGPTA